MDTKALASRPETFRPPEQGTATEGEWEICGEVSGQENFEEVGHDGDALHDLSTSDEGDFVCISTRNTANQRKRRDSCTRIVPGYNELTSPTKKTATATEPDQDASSVSDISVLSIRLGRYHEIMAAGRALAADVNKPGGTTTVRRAPAREFLATVNGCTPTTDRDDGDRDGEPSTPQADLGMFSSASSGATPRGRTRPSTASSDEVHRRRRWMRAAMSPPCSPPPDPSPNSTPSTHASLIERSAWVGCKLGYHACPTCGRGWDTNRPSVRSAGLSSEAAVSQPSLLDGADLDEDGEMDGSDRGYRVGNGLGVLAVTRPACTSVGSAPADLAISCGEERGGGPWAAWWRWLCVVFWWLCQ